MVHGLIHINFENFFSFAPNCSTYQLYYVTKCQPLWTTKITALAVNWKSYKMLASILIRTQDCWLAIMWLWLVLNIQCQLTVYGCICCMFSACFFLCWLIQSDSLREICSSKYYQTCWNCLLRFQSVFSNLLRRVSKTFACWQLDPIAKWEIDTNICSCWCWKKNISLRDNSSQN